MEMTRYNGKGRQETVLKRPSTLLRVNLDDDGENIQGLSLGVTDKILA